MRSAAWLRATCCADRCASIWAELVRMLRTNRMVSCIPVRSASPERPLGTRFALQASTSLPVGPREPVNEGRRSLGRRVTHLCPSGERAAKLRCYSALQRYSVLWSQARTHAAYSQQFQRNLFQKALKLFQRVHVHDQSLSRFLLDAQGATLAARYCSVASHCS